MSVARDENLSNAIGAVADSIGASGAIFGLTSFIESVKSPDGEPLVVFVGGVLAGPEQIFAPNLVNDFSVRDRVSTGYAEYLKSTRELAVSGLLDIATWVGAAGAELLTNQVGVAVVTKIALNAATSYVNRTLDSTQLRRRRVVAA